MGGVIAKVLNIHEIILQLVKTDKQFDELLTNGMKMVAYELVK